MPTLSILRKACEGLASSAAVQQVPTREQLLHDCPDPADKDWQSLVALAAMGATALDVDAFDAIVQFLCSVLLAFPGRLLLPALSTTFVEAARLAQRSNAHPATREMICRVLFSLAKTGLTYELHDAIPSVSRWLTVPYEPLLCASATTVQALCSGSSLATESLLCCDGVQNLCGLLLMGSPLVVAKAVNALHALSVDLNVCKEILAVGAVPLLTVLVDSSADGLIVAAAAGLLQNIGREKTSGGVMQASGAVRCVMPLLLSTDAALQAAAIGVLLNMHSGSDESRVALKALIQHSIVEEAVRGIVR